MNNQEVYKFVYELEKGNIVNVYRVLQEKNKYVFHYLTINEKHKHVNFLILEKTDQGFEVIKKVHTKYLGASPINGRTQIDGETELDSAVDTADTKKIVNRLLHEFILIPMAKKTKTIDQFISPKFYYQHNVDNQIGDGVEEIQRSISEMNAHGIDLEYNRVMHQVCQHNFCFAYSQQDWLNPKTNQVELWEYFDLFRVKDHEIIEHWDIIKQAK